MRTFAMRRPRLPAASRIAPICAALFLTACGAAGDWRAQATAQAEAKMRTETGDPSAQFSRVQLTGDNRTGQTCGYVSARFAADGLDHVARFIVYIDGTAGPFVDGGLGKQVLSQQDFANAWRDDCLKEGYAA